MPGGALWKRLKSRLWDIEAVVWGAPEVHGIHYKVPWPRRLARFLRHEHEIAIVVVLLVLLTIYARWG
jgi:hypothetical protein